MLRWQVPKWLNGISLITRVIVCSTILHFIAMVAIFVVYQGSSQFNITISGNMINPNSEIVFMPLHRSLHQQSGAKSSSASQSKGTPKSSAGYIEKTLEVGATTLVKIVQPKLKAREKKEAKKTESKKMLDAKTEKTKIETVSKKETAKPEAKLSTKSSKLEKKVEAAQSQQDTKQETFIENANLNSNTGSPSVAMNVATDSNVVYVGQAEMDALQAQDYIQQELAQHWAPPTGMRTDLLAVVTLIIDFEGAIKKVDITTASGNLLFDTAAKKAAAQITPARWAYGKELSITFKP